MTCALPEPLLPQLGLVRETALLQQVFENAMPGQPVRTCTVLNVRYKPGKSCLAAYHLGMAPRNAETADSQIVSVRFYPPGGSLSRYLKARQRALAEPAYGDPVFHMPDLDAVVWAFPNDRKLPGIPALIDRDRVEREVAPLLMRGARVLRVALEMVRYMPEHGCTVRLSVHPADGSAPRVFYGKTYADERGERTYQNMRALWSGAGRRSGVLELAEACLYEPAHRALWQSAVEGPTLASRETSGGEFVPLLEAAGRAVAALHRENMPGPERLTSADLRARLVEAESCLRRVPHIAKRASKIAAKLVESEQDETGQPVATLHGDLHAKNIVFTGGTAGLIDLDNLSAGNPLYDLGSFVASTCARALANEIGAAEIAPMTAALSRAYEASVPWDVPRTALRWHAAAALVSEQAHRTMIRMKEGDIDALLDMAEQSLAGVGIMGALS